MMGMSSTLGSLLQGFLLIINWLLIINLTTCQICRFAASHVSNLGTDCCSSTRFRVPPDVLQTDLYPLLCSMCSIWGQTLSDLTCHHHVSFLRGSVVYIVVMLTPKEHIVLCLSMGRILTFLTGVCFLHCLISPNFEFSGNRNPLGVKEVRVEWSGLSSDS